MSDSKRRGRGPLEQLSHVENINLCSLEKRCSWRNKCKEGVEICTESKDTTPKCEYVGCPKPGDLSRDRVCQKPGTMCVEKQDHPKGYICPTACNGQEPYPCKSA